jgi:hypothetical protein
MILNTINHQHIYPSGHVCFLISNTCIVDTLEKKQIIIIFFLSKTFH